ncbi:DNA repair protein RecO [Salinimonas chungwhensis]|uniref:DNA repair protein RecO n=1 Tax=Salinimonas chungwhensis TaxID=265425 RepID=UPI0003801743|nr:DNA repair protein RecO [Salinimonas chungwhensis]
MNRGHWLSAYILHRRPYRETSYLVDFFTLETGRISAVAKGVKNSKSDRKSLLQPFSPVKVQLAGKAELKNLNQIESDGRSHQLTGNALFCAMYLNELINRTMPVGLASEMLFGHYQQVLSILPASDTPDILLRGFEFALLEEMGQLPDWLTDAVSEQPVDSEQWYIFVAEQGVTQAPAHIQRGRFPGYGLLEMANGEWTPAARKTAKIITRQALRNLLGDKPLKSRELFR